MAWKDLKAELQKQGELPTVFQKSADDIAFEAIKLDELKSPIIVLAYGKDDRPEHQPLLLDLHLKDVSSLLDRILAYRREARELEVQAVKAATDYLLFKGQSKIEFELEITRLRQKQQTQELSAQQEASVLFDDKPPLNKGFVRIAKGRADQAQAELKDIADQVQLLTEKRDLLQKYHDSYHARHEEPGNAHNYAERATKVLILMAEDVREAWAKANAIVVGYEMIYGVKPSDLPKLDPISFIDDFVIWCRSIIREIEVRSENEIEYDLVLPLVQPNSFTRKPLVDEIDFKTALDAASKSNEPFAIQFDLPNFFFGDDNVRLRGTGLSFGNVTNIVQQSGIDRTATADSYVRLYASVETPDQTRPDGKTIKRPPIRFGNVAKFGSGRPQAFTDRSECHNVYPVGKWKISLLSTFVYKDVKLRTLSQGIEENPLRDLKFHLRIRAKPRANQ